MERRVATGFSKAVKDAHMLSQAPQLQCSAAPGGVREGDAMIYYGSGLERESAGVTCQPW